ncbi:hypothetical protein Tco_1385431 [Tanacetum coccineum]
MVMKELWEAIAGSMPQLRDTCMELKRRTKHTDRIELNLKARMLEVVLDFLGDDLELSETPTYFYIERKDKWELSGYPDTCSCFHMDRKYWDRYWEYRSYLLEESDVPQHYPPNTQPQIGRPLKREKECSELSDEMYEVKKWTKQEIVLLANRVAGLRRYEEEDDELILIGVCPYNPRSGDAYYSLYIEPLCSHSRNLDDYASRPDGGGSSK